MQGYSRAGTGKRGKEIHDIVITPGKAAQGMCARATGVKSALCFTLAGWAEVHYLDRRAQQAVAQAADLTTEQRNNREGCPRFAQTLCGPENEAEGERAQD